VLIHLFIPDIALRLALLEQAGFSDGCNVEEGNDLHASLQSGALIVLDEAACTTSNLKILLDAKVQNKIIYLHSPTEKTATPGWVSESFIKPFRLGDLLARLQSFQNSSLRDQYKPCTFGPYKFEFESRQVTDTRSNAVIRLTEKESQLLNALAQNETALDRESLLAAVWGYDNQIDTHTLETHIYQLRRKLDPEGEGHNWLVNEQGAYRLNRHLTPIKSDP